MTAVHVRGRRAFVVVWPRGTVPQHLQLVLGRRGAWRVIISTEPGVVTGPRDRRPATARERAGVLAGRRQIDPSGFCETAPVSVSRIDARYAVFELNCPTANGDALFVREHGRWRQLDIDPFECREAPRGVIRSLLGSCLTG